jgi:cyclic pyranopterin phosphate synthase
MYCVPQELIERLSHEDILTYEEILRTVNVGIHLGITKVRVTGGEPLVRKGVYDFLTELTQIPGLSDVSLTTNGVFLKDNIEKIRSAIRKSPAGIHLIWSGTALKWRNPWALIR